MPLNNVRRKMINPFFFRGKGGGSEVGVAHSLSGTFVLYIILVQKQSRVLAYLGPGDTV